MNISLASLAKKVGRDGPVILLESQSREHPWSRLSYLAAEPEAEIKAYGRRIYIKEQGRERTIEANPWHALQAFRERHGEWLFGYLGYDLKNATEQLVSEHQDPVGAPDLYFMVPGLLAEQDRKKGSIHCIKGELPDLDSDEESKSHEDELYLQNIETQTSKKEYLRSISVAQQDIQDGEFYEVNLSHQLKGDFRGDPWLLYQKMKTVGPVPFGAYFQFDDVAVCCQSPERFLRKEGATVFTQPIKGTAPRGSNEQEDEELRKGLAESEKERAENLMIVDLVRNDLSRIAQEGTVKVSNLFEIESFSTVHQMVSTIEAVARKKDPVTILRSCFPMGSMTGAPKIRAMKAIEQLENYRRGIYSGAIGYIKPNCDFDFNVVIRSAIIKGNELFYAVGGAITGDSDPEAEWEETLIKAQALVDAIGE